MILVFSAAYVPGFRAGGPIRSLANLVEHLGDELEFRVVTRNRDLGATAPYDSVQPNAWTSVGKALVWYSSLRSLPMRATREMIRDLQPSVLYVNSFFGFAFSLKPVVTSRLAGLYCPVVIAPRGEFSPGARAIKSWKKVPYVRLVRSLGLLTDAVWQASSPLEGDHIKHAMGASTTVVVAPNLPSPSLAAPSQVNRQSESALRVGFLSRISPKKNLRFAIAVLQRVQARVEFVIQGPREDASYWRECEAQLGALPDNVTVRVLPEVSAQEVPAAMAGFDLFFLPTHGENYGHVIAEALGVGTPVLISDQTPWRDLARGDLGWDLPLDDVGAFVAVIERVADMTQVERIACRERVLAAARERLRLEVPIEQNRRMFLSAIGKIESV